MAFGETVYESFSVAIDPNKIRKKPGKNYVVTPLAVTYKTSSINVHKYFEPLIAISVAFEIPGMVSFIIIFTLWFDEIIFISKRFS